MQRISAIAPDQFTTFGELLKYLRRRAGLTQRELSLAVGYSDTQISRMEQNQRVPDQVTLMAQFVPPLDLVHEPEWLARLLKLAAETRLGEAATPHPGDAPSPALRHNLPAQTTPFVGREKELAEIDARLKDPTCRLLTLVGPGGIGKTRLALEAAAAQIDPFSHGVYFVSLAPLQAVDGLAAALAQALNFSFYQGSHPWQQLLDYLRAKRMLLLMDNLEHLLLPVQGGSGVETRLMDILQAAAQVKILATSRARLGVQGEYLLPLAGLEAPAPEAPVAMPEAAAYSAIELFRQSARRVQVNFQLSPENWPHVTQICRLVDGIPLGVLLAASWSDLLSPEEIAAQIRQSLDFLKIEGPDLPERQRSMRAVFDHSWRLLTEREKAVFQQLSLFHGGFTPQAAQVIARASLQELLGLVNKSLLRRAETGRYEIHELLRQYGAEKLAQTPPAEAASRDRHSAYYCAFLQEREAGLRGKQQKIALDEIQAEAENVRAAWRWAVEQRQSEALEQALDSLYQFYWLRNRYEEGEALFRQAAERLEESQELPPGKSKILLGKALARQGSFCINLGLYNLAEKLLQRALALARHWQAQTEIAFCLIFLGDVVGAQQDFITAESLYQESLTISQAVGRPLEMADALERLGNLPQVRGDYLQARSYHQQSLTLLREGENQSRVAYITDGLGFDNFLLGEYDEAEQYHRQTLAFFKAVGDQFGMVLALGGLGLAAWGRGGGGLSQAKQLMEESLALCREVGPLEQISSRLNFLGDIAISMERYEEAQRYFEESLALAKQFGFKRKVSWSLIELSEAALGLGDLQAARNYLLEALASETANIPPFSLGVLARAWGMYLKKQADWAGATSGPEALANLEQKKQAVEILSLVMVHPATWQVHKDRVAPLLAELEAELPPEVFTAAQGRGKARDLWATAKELLEKLKE